MYTVKKNITVANELTRNIIQADLFQFNIYTNISRRIQFLIKISQDNVKHT